MFHSSKQSDKHVKLVIYNSKDFAKTVNYNFSMFTLIGLLARYYELSYLLEIFLNTFGHVSKLGRQ